jgi:hypothetical protein
MRALFTVHPAAGHLHPLVAGGCPEGALTGNI